MATFPQTLYPKYGYKSWQEEMKSRSNPRSGKFQQKDIWNRTRFMADMSFELRTGDALVVYGFWKQNRNVTFNFFDYDDDQYYGVSVGTGDGVTASFTIPAKATSSRVIYVAGVAKVAGVDYNITVAGGALGEDLVVFIAGHIPTAGQAITADYVGKGRFLCDWATRPEKETSGRARQLLRVSVQENFG